MAGQSKGGLVKAGLLQNNSKADSDKNTNTAAAKAGKAFGVGASYVATAKKAAKENPELAADAKSGKVEMAFVKKQLANTGKKNAPAKKAGAPNFNSLEKSLEQTETAITKIVQSAMIFFKENELPMGTKIKVKELVKQLKSLSATALIAVDDLGGLL